MFRQIIVVFVLPLQSFPRLGPDLRLFFLSVITLHRRWARVWHRTSTPGVWLIDDWTKEGETEREGERKRAKEWNNKEKRPQT